MNEKPDTAVTPEALKLLRQVCEYLSGPKAELIVRLIDAIEQERAIDRSHLLQVVIGATKFMDEIEQQNGDTPHTSCALPQRMRVNWDFQKRTIDSLRRDLQAYEGCATKLAMVRKGIAELNCCAALLANACRHCQAIRNKLLDDTADPADRAGCQQVDGKWT